MPTTVNITTNYAGKDAGVILLPALQGGDTLNQNLVTVIPGVKEAGTTMKKLRSTGLISNSTCDFTDNGTVNFDDRKLDVKKLQVNMKICVDDFEADWISEEMGDSAFTDLPTSLEQAIIENVLAEVAKDADRIIWQGTDIAGEFEGFLAKFAADASIPAAQKIVNGGIDDTDVRDALANVYKAIPNEIYGDDELAIIVSKDVMKNYFLFSSGFGSSGAGAAGYQSMGTFGDRPMDFLGVPMYAVGGLPVNTIVATRTSNLFFGTGLVADWNELRIVDTRQSLGDRNVRFIAQFYGGVQYGWAEEIVVSTEA